MNTRFVILVPLALLCLVFSACAATGQAKPNAALVAYAQCVRDHGVPDFPNPDAQGKFNTGNSSTALPAAERACAHLLPASGPGSANDTQAAAETRARLYEWAKCMRAHGIDQPDPAPGGILSIAVPADRSSPAFRAANKACGNPLGLPVGSNP